MAEEEKQDEKITELKPIITTPATAQERVVRLLYKIALLSSSSNCECETCKLAKELNRELAKLI